MTFLLLEPKTRHGRNKLHEHGVIWRIIVETDWTACLDGAPGLLIEASPDGDQRWIRKVDDKNFSVKEIAE